MNSSHIHTQRPTLGSGRKNNSNNQKNIQKKAYYFPRQSLVVCRKKTI